MFLIARSFTFPRAVSSVLTAVALLAASPATAQQLGRTWHHEPARTIQMGSVFDATSKVGLVASGASKVAYWSFFLTNHTVHPFNDGPWRTAQYHYVDPVGDLSMSVVRTQSGAVAPANFVAADLDFMGQRILTRRNSAAGSGSVAYQSLLHVARERTKFDTGGNMTNTWEGSFEVSVDGYWTLSAVDASFVASGDARLRQGRTYFWGSNRSWLGFGDTFEIWGGYSPVRMRATVMVNPSSAAGGSDLWTDGCQVREVRRSYAIFQIPSPGTVYWSNYYFSNMFERMM